jgi:hypothetical protein
MIAYIKTIKKELKSILSTKCPKHDNVLILYILASIELINKSNDTLTLPSEILHYLNHIKKSYPGFNYDKLVDTFKLKNNQPITFIKQSHNSSVFALDSNTSIHDDSDMDIDNQINQMIINDSNMIYNIINDKQQSNINLFNLQTIKLARKLFDSLDTNNDGHITAMDLINSHGSSIFDHLILKHKYIDVCIQLLIEYGQIDFNDFLNYIIL